MSLQLTSEQAQQYSTGQVVVLEANEEGYHQIFVTDDVTLTDEGVVTATFTIEKLYAVNEEGTILAGPISFELVDGQYQVTACCLNLTEQSMMSLKMMCSRSEEDPMVLKIDGNYVYDSLLENYTNRLDLNWMEYDCIFFPEYYREETYDTVLMAYKDWELTGYSMKQNIFAGTSWHFELREDEETQEDLYVTVQVTDTLVNTVSSELVPMEQ